MDEMLQVSANVYGKKGCGGWLVTEAAAEVWQTVWSGLIWPGVLVWGHENSRKATVN